MEWPMTESWIRAGGNAVGPSVNIDARQDQRLSVLPRGVRAWPATWACSACGLLADGRRAERCECGAYVGNQIVVHDAATQ